MKHVLSVFLFFFVTSCGNKQENQDKRTGNGTALESKEENGNEVEKVDPSLKADIDRLNSLVEKLANTPVLSDGATVISESSVPVAVPQFGFTLKSYKIYEDKTSALNGSYGQTPEAKYFMLFTLRYDNESVDTDIAFGSTYQSLELNADGVFQIRFTPPGGKIPIEYGDSPLISQALPTSYTVTAEDPLMRMRTPLIFRGYQSGNAVVDLRTGPWVQLERSSSAIDLFNRTVERTNTGFSDKAKMACAYKPQASAEQLTFEDVEVGDAFVDQSQLGSFIAGDDAVYGELRIRNDINVDITSINVKTKTFRFVKSEWSRLYTGRELPGARASTSTPLISGFEKLVRKCNRLAGTGGTFRIIYAATNISSYNDPQINSSAKNNFCSSLDVADRANPNSVTLQSFGDCYFDFGYLSVYPGTWNGSTHEAIAISYNRSYLGPALIKPLEFVEVKMQ